MYLNCTEKSHKLSINCINTVFKSACLLMKISLTFRRSRGPYWRASRAGVCTPLNYGWRMTRRRDVPKNENKDFLNLRWEKK